MTHSLPCTRDEQSSDSVITAVPANFARNGDSDDQQTVHKLVKNAYTRVYVRKGGRIRERA
jgi:hypothetical protein